MHPTDRYKEAVRQANDATIRKFDVHGPYTPGTPEHAFWLEAFDIAMRTRIVLIVGSLVQDWTRILWGGCRWC